MGYGNGAWLNLRVSETFASVCGPLFIPSPDILCQVRLAHPREHVPRERGHELPGEVQGRLDAAVLRVSLPHEALVELAGELQVTPVPLRQLVGTDDGRQVARLQCPRVEGVELGGDARDGLRGCRPCRCRPSSGATGKGRCAPAGRCPGCAAPGESTIWPSVM